MELKCFHYCLTFVVCSNKSQDVLMTKHDSLVDLRLAEPRALLSGGEDLHCHLFSTPAPPPHLSKSPLPYALLEDDGPGNGPLH